MMLHEEKNHLSEANTNLKCFSFENYFEIKL